MRDFTRRVCRNIFERRAAFARKRQKSRVTVQGFGQRGLRRLGSRAGTQGPGALAAFRGAAAVEAPEALCKVP